MDSNEILRVLSTAEPRESLKIRDLRQRAHRLIAAAASTASGGVDKTTAPVLLEDLLQQVVKPLFTGTQHPSLTSTGRKNAFTTSAASTAPRFVGFEEDERPWKKAGFTLPLLKFILSCYSYDTKEKAAESSPSTAAPSSPTPPPPAPGLAVHFHLLVPPILNLIDDGSASNKAGGCLLLHILCDNLRSARSPILSKTGLGEVFVDALRANFMLLPQLTPEDESLAVLTELYPAYLALVDARLVDQEPSPRQSSTRPPNKTSDVSLRESLLTTLYHHGILASLSHLSSGPDLGSTISSPLTSLLLRQIPPVFQRLGIATAKHLQSLLPMLRATLMDPFVLIIAPPHDIVSPTLDVLETVISLCGPRVKDRWFGEILRGLVACWCNCVDELGDLKGSNDKPADDKKGHISDIMRRLQVIVNMLQGVVDQDEFKAVKTRLIQEEKDLKGLFSNE